MDGYAQEMLAIVCIEKFDSVAGRTYVDHMCDSIVLRIEGRFVREKKRSRENSRVALPLKVHRLESPSREMGVFGRDPLFLAPSIAHRMVHGKLACAYN